MVTLWPSRTVWSTPALVVGGLFGGTSVMVRASVSEEVAAPSSAVNVNVTVVRESTCGAVNETDVVLAPARFMLSVELWVHA